MQRRQRKVEISNFSVVKCQQLNRLILQSASHYKNTYQEYLDQKTFTNPQIYLLLLESLEEQIRESLSKLRVSKEENKENSNFLIIKNYNQSKQNQNMLKDQKILYLNKLYDIDYKFNGQNIKLNYKDFEKLDHVVKQTQDMMQQIKKLQKKLINCHIALKDMDDNMQIRQEEFQKYVNQKYLELQKKEKKYEKRNSGKRFIF